MVSEKQKSQSSLFVMSLLWFFRGLLMPPADAPKAVFFSHGAAAGTGCVIYVIRRETKKMKRYLLSISSYHLMIANRRETYKVI